MDPHIGAKFQKIPALGYGDTQDRPDGRTNGRTNGTEFQGPIPPSSGDEKRCFWLKWAFWGYF